MSEMLIAELIKTDKFVTLERLHLDDVLTEQGLSKNGLTSPTDKARLTGAQVLIRGSVMKFDLTEKAGKGMRLGRVFADTVGIKELARVRVGRRASTATVRINIQAIDTTTSQVLFSETVEGTATVKKFKYNFDISDIDFNSDQMQRSPLGQAIEQAISQAAQHVVAGLTEVEWQGSVIKVSGREVYISAGRESNIEPGVLLAVYESGEDLIDPETNVSLGREDEEIGLIKVQTVKEKYAVAIVVKGVGFKRGNVIRPFMRTTVTRDQ